MADVECRHDLDKFWDDVVGAKVSAEQYGTDRVAAAIYLLRGFMAQSERRISLAKKFEILIRASELLQLICSDLTKGFTSLFDEVIFAGASKDPKQISSQAEFALRFSYFRNLATNPLYRGAFRDWTIILPAEIYGEMIDALEAIAVGETPDMLKPRRSRSHKTNLERWEKARLRACEHVSFLVGQGFKKIAARDLVGAAAGIQPETLRDWEKRFQNTMGSSLKLARDAGKLAVVSKINRSSKQSAHASILQTMHELEGDALSEFAATYREKFRRRHNPN